MNFKDVLQTAHASLLRSKTRTFLTVTALFIGAATLTLTNGIGTGIKSYLAEQTATLGASNVLQIIPSAGAGTMTGANNGPATYDPARRISAGGVPIMTDQDITAIRDIASVQMVVPMYTLTPDYIKGSGDKYVIRTLAQRLGDNSNSLVAGRAVDNTAAQSQIVLPQDYVAGMGYGDAGATVGKQITIGLTDANGRQSTVQAMVSGISTQSLLTPDTASVNTVLARQLHDAQASGLPAASANAFSVVLASFPDTLTPAQIAAIKDGLKAKGYDGQTVKDTQQTFFTVINAVIAVLDAFGAITLLAASFGIINTLYMAVQERTREIGLMKALGMGRRKVFMLFSIEAILIGFWGSVLGVAFAALLGKGINALAANTFLKGIPDLTLLTFPFSTVLSVVAGIMLLAFLAGTLPAARASKKDPIEALRYE